MKWFDRLLRKQAMATTSLQILPQASAVSSPRDYNGFSEEGYQKNVVAFRSIERITDALSSIELVLKRKKKGSRQAEDVLDHPLLVLLDRPNKMQSYQAFTKSAFGYFLISGNNFIQAVGPSEEPKKEAPRELVCLRPDRMAIKPGGFIGIPGGYCYTIGQYKKHFNVDQITGDSPILHMKTFNPLNDWMGMSAIEAAANPIDQYNAAAKWNLALMQNSGRPSGALIVKSIDGTNEDSKLTEEQRASLKKEIAAQYAGAANSGRPLLLEGGMDWKEMGFNPKDMDWISGKHSTSRDIALAFGVPPQLLGIPGDNTYSNYAEAKQAFYLDTVIPLAKFWANHLNVWLLPAFGEEGLYLEADTNSIEALEPMRKQKWEQIQGATFLSTNEKRERLGLGKYKPSEDPADKILVGMGMTPLDDLVAEADTDADEEETDAEDFEEESSTEDEEAEEVEGNDDEETDEEEESEEDGKSSRSLRVVVEGKAINLSNRKAKERYRKFIIAKRKKLQSAFENQLLAAFAAEAKEVAEAVDGVDYHLTGFAINAALDKSEPRMKQILKKNMIRIMREFGKDVLDLGKLHDFNLEQKRDAETHFESYLEDYVEEHAARRIKNVSNTTRKRVRKAIKEAFEDSFHEWDGSDAGHGTSADFAKAVRKAYPRFSKARAATIARTETGIAQNEAHRSAARALGVPGMKKTWLSEQTERSRNMDNGDSTDHYSMHEKQVGLNDKFHVPSIDGADDMDGPGDPDAPADQIINCHCVLVFAKGDSDER
jgi:HK97 family phage portal protein